MTSAVGYLTAAGILTGTMVIHWYGLGPWRETPETPIQMGVAVACSVLGVALVAAALVTLAIAATSAPRTEYILFAALGAVTILYTTWGLAMSVVRRGR